MNLILFDDSSRVHLLPLTYTRPVSGLRVGIFTIREKWEKMLQLSASTLTEEYLSGKFPSETGEDNLLVNASLIPDEKLTGYVSRLKQGQVLVRGQSILALRCDRETAGVFNPEQIPGGFRHLNYDGEINRLQYGYDIFRLNGWAIENDFELFLKDKKTEAIPKYINLYGPEKVFIEPDAKVSYANISTVNGPVYIGTGAEIMEGANIRGPFALCRSATVKMGAKIYGPTTIGPFSKVGGEVNNCVFQGFSNKAHDGFLGQSVIGEWCNIGADSNNSNLKNNYAEVKLWNYFHRKFMPTGLQFCGLIMGDHSKCGINTMFNTGTVVGVNANIYGAGFPRNFIPSFSWGGPRKMTVYELEKAFEVAAIVMKRKNLELDDMNKKILAHIFRETEKYRKA